MSTMAAIVADIMFVFSVIFFNEQAELVPVFLLLQILSALLTAFVIVHNNGASTFFHSKDPWTRYNCYWLLVSPLYILNFYCHFIPDSNVINNILMILLVIAVEINTTRFHEGWHAKGWRTKIKYMNVLFIIMQTTGVALCLMMLLFGDILVQVFR